MSKDDESHRRRESGKALRAELPLEEHASVPSADQRPDPVTLLQEQATDRVPELVPIRYGRMLASPFAFYRGAARLMTEDLARGPATGLTVQLCGDAHLSNFGMFASPERRLVFDLNDFDETLPGPFEWDVKRLAASIEVAARGNGLDRKRRRSCVVEAVAHYRTTMRQFAKMSTLEVWYAGVDVDELVASSSAIATKGQLRAANQQAARARSRDGRQALRKLTEHRDGRVRIVNDPPLVQPIEAMSLGATAEQFFVMVDEELREYRRRLAPERRRMLGQFRVTDIAHKVVGVGSVGTRAWIVLLQGPAPGDLLLLQLKEAQASVLESALGPASGMQHGERVVLGQRLMQAASDPFLGWKSMPSLAEGMTPGDYYVRQLRDWKGSVPIEDLKPDGLVIYSKLCAWSLARAHARTGDRFAIAGYLGKSKEFEHAIGDFAASYADLNERDYQALAVAESSGRIVAERGV